MDSAAHQAADGPRRALTLFRRQRPAGLEVLELWYKSLKPQLSAES